MNLADLPGPELIEDIAAAFVDGGRGLQANLQPLAQQLVGGLVLLQMCWFGIQALLESMVGSNLGALLAQLFRYIMLVGLVEWFLGAYDLVFFQALYGGVDAVVQAVAGSGGESQAFLTAWQVFFDLILAAWNTIEATPAHFLAGSSPLGAQFWGSLLVMVISWCLLFGSLCAFVACLVVIALVHVLGAALVGMGLALGPFFVPWLMVDHLRGLFSGWLRFVFTACFYRVVAVTLLQLAKPVFLSLQKLVVAGADPTQAHGSLDILLSSILLIIVSSVICGLMARVPQLTSALTGHGRPDAGIFFGLGRRLGQRNFRSGGGRSRGGRSWH